MLTKLYDLQGHTERAIHLLELERERFTREKARYLWIELMVELLVKREDTSGATALLESYIAAHNFCNMLVATVILLLEVLSGRKHGATMDLW